MRLLAVLGWVKALASLILANALLASLFGRSGLVLAHLSLVDPAHTPVVVTRLVVIADPLAGLLGTEKRGEVASIVALNLATMSSWSLFFCSASALRVSSRSLTAVLWSSNWV